MAKKEELKKKLEIVSGTQRKLQKEYDDSKAKLDKVQAEQNNLLAKLATAEKFRSKEYCRRLLIRFFICIIYWCI